MKIQGAVIAEQVTPINMPQAPDSVNHTGFKELLDGLTGGNIAREIKEKYDVTLDITGEKSVYSLLDAHDIRCKNYVAISHETLKGMESDPALKKKVINAIEEFSSPEEQKKVDALQPPVKSAGMIIYPNGDALYWLEGYPNDFENNNGKKPIITSREMQNINGKYIEMSGIVEDNTYDLAASVLASVLKRQTVD